MVPMAARCRQVAGSAAFQQLDESPLRARCGAAGRGAAAGGGLPGVLGAAAEGERSDWLRPSWMFMNYVDIS